MFRRGFTEKLMFSESPYLRFALLLNLKMLDFLALIVLLIV